MNTGEKEQALTLELLETIDQQSDVTQRHLADRLGVALGLTNSYLKRCVRKGLIKIHEAPANRYLYYLTPKGFTEKSRLTAAYLSASFNFYRRASLSCEHVFKQCKDKDMQKVLLCGLSELAEIASLRAKEQNIEIIGLLERKTTIKDFIGLPVWTSMDLLPDFDVCVITDVKDPNGLLEYLYSHVAKDTVFIPDILGVNVENKTDLV